MNTNMTVDVIINNMLVDKQIDLAKLSLSRLLELKNQLMGKYDRYVPIIDAILSDYHLETTVYNSFQNAYNRYDRKKKTRIRNKINKHNRRK